jgi:hypothetical protein
VSERVVAVLVRPTRELPADLAAAMLSDVVDLVADTPQVDSALVVASGAQSLADSVAWPGTLQVAVSADPTLTELLAAVAPLATAAAAVVVPDVPDLPTLLIGKLFSALAGPPRRALAVCPAQAGGLVAAATSSPGPADWLGAGLRLDDAGVLDQVRQAAPPREVVVGPGWHRVRSEADLARLDPGLEGWEATRTWLAGPSR